MAFKWIFSFKEIDKISLCARVNNEAIKIYKKAGFKEEHTLSAYRKEIKTGDM